MKCLDCRKQEATKEIQVCNFDDISDTATVNICRGCSKNLMNNGFSGWLKANTRLYKLAKRKSVVNNHFKPKSSDEEIINVEYYNDEWDWSAGDWTVTI